MSIKKRLKEIMDYNNLNLKEFSEKCKTPYNTLQNYLLGRRKIGIDTVAKLHVQLDVNTNWLLTGQGAMYNDAPMPKPIPNLKGKTVNEIDEHLKTLRPAQREEIFGRTLEMVRMNEMEEKLERLLKERDDKEKGIEN